MDDPDGNKFTEQPLALLAQAIAAFSSNSMPRLIGAACAKGCLSFVSLFSLGCQEMLL